MSNPTIVEVAKHAGVSITTVSRCVNAPEKVGKKTLAKVRASIAALRYSPNVLAQSFRRGRTNIILVVVHEFGSPLLGEILKGIRSVLENRYVVLVTQPHEDASDQNFVEMLMTHQVEGVILLCSLLPYSAQLAHAKGTLNLPIVIGLEPLNDDLAHLPRVGIDNFKAAQEATLYLISLGHSDIVFISGALGSFVTKDREAGFLSAMRQANIEVTPISMVNTELSLKGGIEAVEHILTRAVRPTALFCANDDLALGALSALHKAGVHVPKDMSLMGFDDMRYAAFANPALSTVEQPSQKIGMAAAHRLLAELEAKDLQVDDTDTQKTTEIVPHRLVIRQSTGPAK